MATRGMCTDAAKFAFESLKISSPQSMVYHVEINRPEYNVMNRQFWRDMVACFNLLNEEVDCRSIVISGAGKLFSAGLDLKDFSNPLNDISQLEPGRKAFALKKIITSFQESFNAIEKCSKPVIGAIHGACIGGAVDLICACDIRYCSKDAWFQVKEVDLGLAADVGTLQRLPKIVGNESLVRELCYTARPLTSSEAKSAGLVSRVFESKEDLLDGALRMASIIAEKSPIAVQVTKLALVYARDHSVEESLNQIALFNQSMLQSEDVQKSINGMLTKTIPTFSKL